MKRIAFGLLLAPLSLLVNCGGGGDDGDAWGSDKGNPPAGLSVLIGSDEIETGTLAFDFKDVPVYSVSWDERLGSQLRSDIGLGGGVILSTEPNGTVGPALLYPELTGDGAEAFKLTVDMSFAFSFAFRIECVPPRAGVFTATLLSGIQEVEGKHHLRLRCEAVDGYAMLPGEMISVNPHTGDLVMGQNFQFLRQWSPGAEMTELDPFRATLVQKGLSTAARFLNEGRSLLLGTELIDLEAETVEPLLSPAELTSLQPIVGQVFSTPDASVVAFASDRKIFRKRAGQELESFEPAAAANPILGTYKVFHLSSDGRYVYYYFDTSYGIVFDQTWRLDSTTGESEAWGLFDASGAPLAGAPASGKTVLFSADDSQVFVLHSLQGEIGLFVYDTGARTVRPLFENVLEHLSTLPGRTGTIALVSDLRLSPDERYLSLAVNYFSGADYWGGPKSAYVYDLLEDEAYSIGVFADGSPISGDGWAYSDTAILEGGSAAYTSVSWSGGASGEGIPHFTLVVPRSRWVKVD